MIRRFRTIALLSLAGALVGLAALAVIPQLNAAGKQVTLTGTITDSMCGAKHMMSGDDAKCVRACVKNGSHYALLAGDKVYILNGKGDELDRLAGQQVIVSRTMSGSSLALVSVKAARPGSPASSKPSTETEPPAQVATIEGLVRDIACPIQNKEATATKFNLKCAQDCARLGSPLIVLTEDGTIYTPISESMPDTDQRQRLMPFLGKYVQVSVQVFERAGTHAIAIRDIKEKKGVHLITNAELAALCPFVPQ